MLRRTLAIAVKELLQLRRDLRTALTLIVMPVLLLFVYGYALSFDVQHIRLAVVDHDGTQASRDAAQAFLRSGYFDLIAQGQDERMLDPLFDRGAAQAALVVPFRYASDLSAGRATTLQFVLDGSDSQTATTILGYARQIAASLSPLVDVGAASGPIVPVPLVWYNPDLSSTRFLVPGLLAFILMVSSVIATALAVVREKERGTMESLRATPLVAVELLLGKTLPYLVVAFVSAGGALLVAHLLFDVPVRGSLFWLAAVTLLFLAVGLAWGVLVSTIADSQQVAFQLALLSSMLPTMILSGFIFPISSMPAFLQWLTRIVPARYYLVALRGIVLKGAGPSVWWPEMASLGVFGALLVAIATARTVRSL
ncbi:MAG TPA: ABC transporter permease [Solirubrobacteraceae bacterium]|nr:ABC transporter permease [Solirubrobacteraceae bacterium]